MTDNRLIRHLAVITFTMLSAISLIRAMYNKRTDEWNSQDEADRLFFRIAMKNFPYKPQPKNLDDERLMKRMKNNFDPSQMSLTRPKQITENKNGPTTSTPTPRRKNVAYDTKLLNGIAKLNFSYIDDDGDVIEFKDRERKMVEKWLLQGSTCRVQFAWRDLSEFFWPRWLRVGECDTSVSCSWPPGMYCVPSDSRSVRIMKWICHAESERSLRSKGRKPHVRESRKENGKNKNLDFNIFVQNALRQDSTTPAAIEDNNVNVLETRVIKSSDGIPKSLSRRGRKSRKRKKKVRCKWTKIRYPITTGCSCSC